MSSLDLNRRRFLTGAGTTAAAALVGVAVSTLVGASGAAWGAAPMLGPVEPKVYRFKLGGFEATMIADSNAFVDGPWPLIGGNAERSAVDELMTANLVPANKYQPGFTPMIVNTGKEVVIFDTGNGERGFVPRPKGGWLANLYRDHVVPMAEKTTFLNPGDEVVPGIRAIGAYGHTPGHLGFDIESEGKRLVFWGDCAHHQVASLARPDWHCVFDIDKEEAAKTRPHVRHGRDRPCRGQRLPYAVSLAGLRRAEKGRRLSLDRAFLPTQGLMARS